jgi:hypothetical protein
MAYQDIDKIGTKRGGAKAPYAKKAPPPPPGMAMMTKTTVKKPTGSTISRTGRDVQNALSKRPYVDRRVKKAKGPPGAPPSKPGK